MSANQPSIAEGAAGRPPSRRELLRPRWLAVAAAAAIGIGIGVALALLASGPHRSAVGTLPQAAWVAAATWPAGARPAPGFRLRDQYGRPLSLAAYRGRPVIVTFIDPLCRNLCPLEARVLGDVERQFPAALRPAIVAVSVNPAGDTAANFRLDAGKWQLPTAWRWGVGVPASLARVWRHDEIAVQTTTRVIAGSKVREVAHTEASYVVDPHGDLRALYLYPFRAASVVQTVKRLEGAPA